VALRVRLLGGLDVDGVEFSRLGSRKARTMLARLALGRGAPVPADALIDVVWPGADRPQRPNDQLSVLASRMRSVLGGPALPRQGRGYALALDWLDIDAVADLVGEARKRLDGGALAPARSAIEAAIALDRGSLLPEEEGDWIDAERAAAARTGVLARMTAAEIALAAGDPWTAAQAAQAARDLDRYDESALRLLMSALAGSGRSAQGISAYLDFQGVIREELGVDPDPATTASYMELLRVERTAPAAPVRPARAGLVGRAAEVRRLDEALAEARGRRVVLVAVYGEAGIGKTRLLDFWADGRTDATVLRAVGSELGGDLPLQPLLDAVAIWLRRNPHREPELLGGPAQALAPLIGAGAVDDVGVGRVLALFGDARSAGPSVLFAALDTVVGRLAAGGPVVLAIDDGHWLDRATSSWLRHAQVRLADHQLLVVFACRPGEGRPPPATEIVHMGPLDLAAVTELVGSPRAARLHERSGGHPLFLMELMHANGDDDLPASIRDAVVERCERTGPAAATLRTAAVLGPEVDLDLVSAVLGAPPTVLLDHFEEGVRRHLLVEDGHGFRFRHQLIREALCLATGPGRTALLHRTAARSLRARGRRADPLDVAYHARLGGDLTLAAHALADAGDLAAARYDHDESLRLFDTALSTEDLPELRLRRARAALPAGRYEEAAADAGAALAGGVGAEGMETAAIAAYLARDFRRCRRLAEDGARLAGDAVLRASCLSLAGRVCHVDGDLAAADRSLALAREAAPPEVRPLAQLWTAPLWTDRGEPSAALDLLGEAAPALVARHPFVEPHRHLAAAQALGLLGRADEALAELAQVDRTAAEQRTERFAARADNCRAWILRNVGAHDEADARNDAAYARTVGEAVWTEPTADALLGLADGRLRAGEPGAARVLLDRYRAEAAAPHPFAWRQVLRATLLGGWCSLTGGDAAAALAAAADIVAEAEALVVPRYAALGRALAAAAGGEPLDGAEVRRYAPLEADWLAAMAGRDEQR
jgi:DNA-binding SARP family transcriptional activator